MVRLNVCYAREGITGAAGALIVDLCDVAVVNDGVVIDLSDCHVGKLFFLGHGGCCTLLRNHNVLGFKVNHYGVANY